MGFFEAYRRKRLVLSVPESLATLQLMGEHFSDPSKWTKDMYANANGARCLVGAANHVKCSSLDDAKHWIRCAIDEVAPGTQRIEDFNDRATYDEVLAVIERAKQLCLENAARARPAPATKLLPAQAPVAEYLPAPYPAPAPASYAPPPRVYRNPQPERSRRLRSLATWIME